MMVLMDARKASSFGTRWRTPKLSSTAMSEGAARELMATTMGLRLAGSASIRIQTSMPFSAGMFRSTSTMSGIDALQEMAVLGLVVVST